MLIEWGYGGTGLIVASSPCGSPSKLPVQFAAAVQTLEHRYCLVSSAERRGGKLSPQEEWLVVAKAHPKGSDHVIQEPWDLSRDTADSPQTVTLQTLGR